MQGRDRRHRRRPRAALGRSRGYTLLEVLVAVAAVGMVAALILPLAARSRVRARQESCADNLRRIARGAMLYAQDYDGFPPPASIDHEREVPGFTWFGPLTYWPHEVEPYVTAPAGARAKDEVFRCPDAPNDAVPLGPGMEWKTYAINLHVAPRVNRATPPRRRLSDVRRPEGTGLFVDSAGVCLLASDEFVLEPVSEASYFWGASGQARSTYPAHFNGVNLAYVDGHVGWLSSASYLGDSEVARRLWGEPFGE